MRSVLRVLAWLMVPALLTGPKTRAEELSPPQIYQRVVGSTLALKVTTVSGERFVGAAFLVGEADLAVTALHVIQDAAEIRGTFHNGEDAAVGEVIATDKVHDLALLRVRSGSRPPLPLATRTPPVAARLYAIGSPRGYSFSITDGILSQIQLVDGYDQYQLTCPFSPGNSGGPVLNTAGEVVGVAAWTKLGAQNLNFAIPAKYVAELGRPKASPPIVSEAPAADEGASTSVLPVQGKGSAAVDAGDFDRFQQWLRKYEGRAVRISVSSGGATETFECRVPLPNSPEATTPATQPSTHQVTFAGGATDRE